MELDMDGEEDTVLGLGLTLGFETRGLTDAPADAVAPSLSNPTDAASGPAAGMASVATDEGNGILYWVMTGSRAAPTKAQVKAGQDHTGAPASAHGLQIVIAAGTQTVAASGLTPSSAYYTHFMHEDAALNRSGVASSDGFTTAAERLLDRDRANIVFALDPSQVFSTLYTDTGATTVASAGQTIGAFRCGITGRLAILVAGAGPTLVRDGSAWYLDFHTDARFASTAPIDLTAVSGIGITAGLNRATGTSARIVVEHSANLNGNQGAFYLTAPQAASGQYGLAAKTTAPSSGNVLMLNDASHAAGIDHVVSAVVDVSQSQQTVQLALRRDGTTTGTTFTQSATAVGSLGNHTMHFFGRGTGGVSYRGQCHGLYVRSGVPDANLLEDYERFVAARQGRTP